MRKTNLHLLLKYTLTWALFLFVIGILPAAAQSVSGIISDKDGDPLINTSILVKGTTKGTISDINGKFTLNAAVGDTLLFKYLGYKNKEVKITNADMGKIVMEEENTSHLDEVIVVGYGTQRKRDVAASITSVDEKAIAAKQPYDLLSALQGDVAGMQITQTSGEPGEEANVIIRGISTIESGRYPLYVIDGIIMPEDFKIGVINPSDVLSVEIMKDAASASIYGARSTNGVILVTTKTASKGKAQVSVKFLNSYGTLANKLPQLNRAEREIFDNTVVSASGKNQFQWFRSNADSVNLQARTSNDYQEIISRIAVRNDATISIQSGSDKMNVYTSLGLLDETGIILTSYNKRYTGRSKVVYNVSPNIKFTTNIFGTFQNRNKINEGQTFYQAIRRPTQSILYFPDGSLVGAWESNPSGKRNPLIELFYRKNEQTKYTGQLYQGAEIKFDKYLTLNASATANLSYDETVTYSGPETQTALVSYENGLDAGSDNTAFNYNILLESFLRYSRKFDKVHNLEIMGGLSSQTDNTTTRIFDMGNFLIKDDNMYVPQAISKDLVGSITGTSSIIMSQFGRISYDYISRYIFRANIRRDGSSRFGINNRWGVFPSVSGAWRLSDEFFMDWSKPALSDAKFRVSWGKTGNDRIGDFDWRTMFEGSTSNSYGNFPGAYPKTRLGNPDLKWEITTQLDYGLDLNFLNGRLMFVADYYVKTTDDVLYDEDLPTEIGYTKRRVNIGSIENKGIELSLTAIPVATKDWTWTTTVNWSKNRNKLLKLEGAYGPFRDNWFVEADKPTGNFYGYKNLGVYQYNVSNAWTEDYKTRLIPVFERDTYGNVIITKSGGPVLIGYQYADGRDYGWKADGTGNKVYQMKSQDGSTVFTGGDVIWEDVDGNGIIDSGDKQILANAQPNWYAGWSNTVNYRDFSLNFHLYTSWGGTVYNQLLYDLSKFGDNTSNADPRATVQGWRYQGQITDWYAPGNGIRGPQSNGRQLNSFYLEDATFIRLQTVRLSYQLASRMANYLKLKNLQLYVYGNNIATWTNYRGYDPEISTGGVLNPGADNQKYPKKREYGFGFNLTF